MLVPWKVPPIGLYLELYPFRTRMTWNRFRLRDSFLTQTLWVMMKVILKFFFFNPTPDASNAWIIYLHEIAKNDHLFTKGNGVGNIPVVASGYQPYHSFVGAWCWGMDNFILTSYFGRTLCGARTRRFYVFSFEVLFSGLSFAWSWMCFCCSFWRSWRGFFFVCVSKLGSVYII